MSTGLRRSPSSTALLTHLIESPGLVQRVRELKPASFAQLVKQVGLEDAGELVALATTAQLVRTFDEDLFHGTRPGEREAFDPARFATWLEVLLEAGEAAAAARVAELSEDFVTHALDGLVLVFDQDALAERMSAASTGRARLVERALGAAPSEELDGYLLVSRATDGWDAVLSLILALDRDHRELLERLLDRCVAINRELMDDLEELGSTLTAGASLAEDVEAEREARRAREGFVEPRDARAFLALARKGKGAADVRDPITKAYLRELERREAERSAPEGARHLGEGGAGARRAQGPSMQGGARHLGRGAAQAAHARQGAGPTAKAGARQLDRGAAQAAHGRHGAEPCAPATGPSTGGGAAAADPLLETLEGLVAEAARAEAEAEEAPRRRGTAPLLPAGSVEVVEALQALKDSAPEDFSARLEELAYLSNVLTAGASVRGRAMRPSEAAEAALATVALGAELIFRSAHPRKKPTAADLAEVLAAHGADALFRRGSAAVGGEGLVLNRQQLEAALAAARRRQ